MLIELGYALKVLGPDRVVMVMNKNFGEPSLLPFDLRMRRVLTYSAQVNAEDRSLDRNALAHQLETAIKLIVSNSLTLNFDQSSPMDEVINSINSIKPNVASLVRDAMGVIIDELALIAPNVSEENELDELVVEAIDKSTIIVNEFSRMTSAIAQMNSYDGAIALYKSFQRILDRYEHPRGFSGFPKADCDFFKFVGHEMFVCFISQLILEKRWDIISDILREEIFLENNYKGVPDTFPYTFISQEVPLLRYRKNRLALKGRSVRADILNLRHSDDNPVANVKMNRFVEADLFLFLRSEKWYAESALYLTQIPSYLFEAKSKSFANQLLRPLALESVEEFRELLTKRFENLKRDFGARWYLHRIEGKFDPDTVGSR